MTLLVLLPRTAGTRIVSADFRSTAHNLLRRGIPVRSRHARLLQFAFFAPLELCFQIVHGCGRASAWGRRRCRLLVAIVAGCSGGLLDSWCVHDLHVEEVPHRVFL